MGCLSLFKVSNFIIHFKDSRNLEIMATGANIPGLSIGELNIGRTVIRDLRNGDSLTFNDLVVTALLDEKLNVFKEVYNYIILAANPDTADITVEEPIFDSTLLLTTNKNNIQHKIIFYNCFFKSIGDVPLNSTSTDEGEAITVDITMGYSYYKFV